MHPREALTIVGTTSFRDLLKPSTDASAGDDNSLAGKLSSNGAASSGSLAFEVRFIPVYSPRLTDERRSLRVAATIDAGFVSSTAPVVAMFEERCAASRQGAPRCCRLERYGGARTCGCRARDRSRGSGPVPPR